MHFLWIQCSEFLINFITNCNIFMRFEYQLYKRQLKFSHNWNIQLRIMHVTERKYYSVYLTHDSPWSNIYPYFIIFYVDPRVGKQQESGRHFLIMNFIIVILSRAVKPKEIRLV
jgi:hypothetical protein